MSAARPVAFRTKLLLAMMAVVTLATAGSLLLTQRNVENAYRRIFEDRFESGFRFFSDLQRARLGAMKEKCVELAGSVRLIAAMEEDENTLLQQIALDELRDVLGPGPGRRASFFRFVDESARLLPPTDARAGRLEGKNLERRLAAIAEAVAAGEVPQQVGYLATGDDASALQEVIVTRIVDPVGRRRLGALVIGFPLTGPWSPAGDTSPRSGLWLDGRFHAPALRDRNPELVAAVEQVLARATGDRGAIDVEVDGRPHRVFYGALPAAAGFSPAWQVSVFPLDEAVREQRDLRRRILVAGSVAFAAALLLSVALSHGLSGPVGALVRGTGEIQRGNLAVRVPVRARDELGRLAESFNAMAEELALKERIRSLLDQVADRHVAEELIRGRVSRSGEIRDVSVLFADIRGFTAMTEEMEPSEVVALLNEHMSALTAVVHEEHGLVDKFVGDSLMAIFGAPASTGDDARRAVACAWRMLQERERLNRSAPTPIQIGIGMASGEVVAGCVGSEDRLSYTVLGSRVNLAARLCAAAGPMELWIDETTYARVRDVVDVEPAAALRLKGFREPVAAYRVTGTGAAAA